MTKETAKEAINAIATEVDEQLKQRRQAGMNEHDEEYVAWENYGRGLWVGFALISGINS